MSSDWRQRANAWLSRHHGIITIAELRDAGANRSQVERMIATGELIVWSPGIYRSGHWPESAEQTMVAICLRYPAAIIAFVTAARMWTYRRLPPDQLIHILIPHAHSPEVPGVVVHRCRRIDDVDVVLRPDGIRLTSPPRTVFDIADMLGPPAAASVLEQVLNDKMFTFGTLTDTVARLGHASRPGTRTMRTVLAGRPAWRRAMQSDLEARVLAEITDQGLPAPETQHPVMVGRGRRIRLDFAWPEARVALEIDHPFWHDGADQSHADKQRDRQLIALGWRTPRLTSFDVERGLRSAVSEIGSILDLAMQASA